jgi:hypothetical protein
MLVRASSRLHKVIVVVSLCNLIRDSKDRLSVELVTQQSCRFECLIKP